MKSISGICAAALVVVALIHGERATAVNLDSLEEGLFSIAGQAEIIYNRSGATLPPDAFVRLLQDGVSTQFGETLEVPLNSSSEYVFEVTCHFIGRGTVEVKDAAAPSGPVIAALSVNCLPETSPAPLASNEQWFDTLAQTSQQPPFSIEGTVESWIYVNTLVLSSVTANETRDELLVFTSTFDGNEVELIEDLTCTHCEGGDCDNLCCVLNRNNSGICIPQGRFVSTRPKLGLDAITETFRVADQDLSTGPDAILIESSSLEVGWSVDSPPGTVTGDLEVIAADRRGSQVRFSEPAGLLMTANGGQTVGAALRSTPSNYGGCSGFVNSGQLSWTFPELQASTSIAATLDGDIEASCTDVSGASGQGTFIEAGFVARFSNPAPILRLEPERSSVAPSGAIVGFNGCDNLPNVNRFGDSSTMVSASLRNLTPQTTYRINVTIDDFDSSVSGHTHDTSPADTLWGNLEGALTATCDVVTDSEGHGVCDFEYQAERVAGDVSLSGTVLEVPESGDPIPQSDLTDETVIAVRIGELIELLPSPEYFFLTGETDEHVMGTNHFGTASTVRRMGVLARLYSESAQVRLEVNDMSLGMGGVFDISGQWAPPHCSHLHGRDVDIGPDRRELETDAVAGPVDCNLDVHLMNAAIEVGADAKCYPDSFKAHIDF